MIYSYGNPVINTKSADANVSPSGYDPKCLGTISFVDYPPIKWEAKIGGVSLLVSTAPNWFHRKMQKLILGIEWSNI